MHEPVKKLAIQCAGIVLLASILTIIATNSIYYHSHIETSGSRQVIHWNAPGLKQESSYSGMVSLDYHKNLKSMAIDIQLEGFYTLLRDPFTTEFTPPDSAGTVIYARYNSSDGAYVYGINLQVNFIPVRILTLSTGFTWRQSRYEAPQEFSAKRFFRTPDTYGFLTFDWHPFQDAEISSTLNYTGPMLIPYFGTDQPDPDKGELRTSGNFFDWGMKLSYTFHLNGSSLQLYCGMKNILNSYQEDFDRGIDRDPGYIYGPIIPRTIYAGLVFGNWIK